jgi:hypothetical protein
MMTPYLRDANFAWLASNQGIFHARRHEFRKAMAMQKWALWLLERVRKPGHPMLERVRQRLAKVEEKMAESRLAAGESGGKS